MVTPIIKPAKILFFEQFFVINIFKDYMKPFRSRDALPITTKLEFQLAEELEY